MDNGWLILARAKTVELYQLPASMDRNAQIEPIERYIWPWKVDSIILASLASNSNHTVKLVQIVIRYGNVHPWVRNNYGL